MVNKRSRWLHVLLTLWVANLSSLAAAPNFVFILTDDLGYGDLACYGSQTIATPRIDALAKAGLRFTHHYVSPICTPTRAAFLTGNHANRSHLPTPLHVYDAIGLPDAIVTLPETLKTKDYHTGLIGKWHLGHQPQHYPTRHGFDTFWGTPLGHFFNRKEAPANDASDLFIENETVVPFPPHAELTERITEHAITYLKAHRDEPFFLLVSHPMPHVPLAVSDRFAGKSKAGLYGDVIECIDWSTGEILDALDTLGIADQTYVVFTSDNGPLTQVGGSSGGLRGEKHDPYEGGVRVPCIIRGPGIPADARCDRLTTIMDWYPTFAALADVPLPEFVRDGKSIAGLLRDPASASPHAAIYYIIRDGVVAGIREGDWKLLLRARKKPVLELYHLAEDPRETDNRFAHEPKRVDALKRKLAVFEQALDGG
ncbi:MAG: arylsulfatase A [Kiritimatiellia bacterium]|jgi:arylsulfatase A